MGTDKGTHVSSDRKKWSKIFDALLHMLQTQQTGLESAAKERKLLENRIKIQYDRWVSDVRLFEDQILQMKRDFVLEELARSLDMAKSDLVVGLKRREASLYKVKLDHADNELADLKVSFDYLSQKCSNPEIVSGGKSTETNRGGKNSNMKFVKNTKEEERHSKILEGEVSKLKHEYEKLSLKKSAEVSALLLEKDFVWNQFKTMESDYTHRLRSKRVEVEEAKEKIEKLLASMEQLQSLNSEKDVTIVTLKTKLAKMEADTNKRNDEISRLSRELELLRKSRSAPVTPVLNRCSVKPRISGLGGKNSGSDRSNVFQKKEPSASQVPDHAKDTEKGSRSLKRKGFDVIPISESPKLFSATFKVPKLKNSSPLVRGC
ncbi:hypothetical protein L1049_025537 [Liquidambar formosana]|uniref:Uncharacterized protein n=1 Tax=Liquidambar formosana TaxID=63359 RepID=A0AAP0NES9_LIQFO